MYIGRAWDSLTFPEAAAANTWSSPLVREYRLQNSSRVPSMPSISKPPTSLDRFPVFTKYATVFVTLKTGKSQVPSLSLDARGNQVIGMFKARSCFWNLKNRNVDQQVHVCPENKELRSASGQFMTFVLCPLLTDHCKLGRDWALGRTPLPHSRPSHLRH